MMTTTRTPILLTGLLLVAALLVFAPDAALACDPDPSDWEAGIEACAEWQDELDREALQQQVTTTLLVVTLVVLPLVGWLVTRKR